MNESKALKDASLWRIFSFWFCWAIFVGILSISVNFKNAIAEPESIYLQASLAGLLLALIIEFKLKGISFQSYIRPAQQKEWKYLLYFIPLIIASVGLSWLLDYTLFKIAPDFLQSRNRWIEQNPIFNPKGGIGDIVITFTSIAVVTPVVEEFLFRGIIFDKLRSRWSIIVGLVVSSFIFGLLHFNLLGAFLVGIVLCILYLETKSLFVPIGIHFLNNFSALLVGLIWSEEITYTADFSYLFEYLWFDIPFLIIGSAWIAWFIYSRRSYLIST